ncbi:SET domain-containing protein [Mycena belliarum]|uniref:SET domain-containing protein n=1 Tax=Mycena belliarum TaxID=1033014 RepID=A0AAD6TUY1_9AGAR|nr:SET domain-containing protein [Mycena belliae]
MIYTDGILYDPAFSDVVKEKCNAVERLSMKEIMKIWKGDQQQRRPKGVHANALRVRVRTRRDEIEEQWNNAASEAGAARIEFVNEIDDEEVPPNIGGLFLYLESSYRFEAGVNPKISPLTGCHCGGVSRCSQRTCHRKSSRNSVRYRPEYDRDLFDLGVDSPVIECNTLCSCSPDCANRVAQRPRTIPIQIFKTEERGWGARATVAIAKGTMVGIYTGLVIRREESEALPGFRIAYCFDLNALESRLEEAPENSYTVDAFSCGNWTRFINHCCEPNLRIIPVFYDTVPQDNLPYLAFMATRNICAYTELTFDYNPADQQAWEHKKFKEKGRAKKKRGKTQTQCRCGAENCRGWLSIPKA